MNTKMLIAILVTAAIVIPPAVYAEKPELSGTFVDGDWLHKTQGTATIVTLEDGSSVLSLEDFKTTNGPDVYVYLATDDKATEFVDLGKIKANNGNQNYEISDIDFSKYDRVLIWCKAFSVLFGTAELN